MGLHVSDLGSATVLVAAIQAVATGGVLERLIETAPYFAVLVIALWIVFAAYRALVERMIGALNANTEAMTKLVSKLDSVDERVRRLEQR
jgi:hypothetical protein